MKKREEKAETCSLMLATRLFKHLGLSIVFIRMVTSVSLIGGPFKKKQKRKKEKILALEDSF